MKIIEKINKKQDFYNNPAATIAFLGDSVSHGCFECFETRPGVIDTIYDIKSGYATKIREFLNILYPSSQINIIDSALSGDNAQNGYTRIERDILPYNPDLCVVSFMLNDACQGIDALPKYKEALHNIFKKLKDNNIEIIFVTENYMCDHVSPFLHTDFEKGVAENFIPVQNGGIVKAYSEAAKEVCKAENVPVVDLYNKWEMMAKNGVNTTELLANKYNHPIREFHKYMAIKVIEAMFEN